MIDILREEITQNTQIEKVLLNIWGKSQKIFFLSNLSFIWN